MSQESQEEVNKVAEAVQDCQISTSSEDQKDEDLAEETSSDDPKENLAKEIELHDKIDRALELQYPKPRMKPATIFLHKTVDFAKHCKELLTLGVNFYQPYLGTNYTRIICLGFNDHKVMRHYFIQNNLPLHTFGHPYKRKIKVIVKGLPKETDMNKLKEALTAAGIPIERVNKMHMKDFAKDRDILVLTVVPFNEEGKKILRLKKAFGHDVQLERPNRKTRQCHRCQRWGHAQRFCYGEIKCVKCAGDHWTRECTRNPDDELPTCVNCGGNHTASYRQCHFCPDSIEYKKNRRCSNKTKQFNAESNERKNHRTLVTFENCDNLYKTIKNIPKHNEAVPF